MSNDITEFESALEETITSLIGAVCKKDTEKGKRIINDVAEQLKSINLDMSDPDQFFYGFMYDVNNSLEQLVAEATQTDVNDKLSFIYIHYNYLDFHIQRFHSSRCGSSGCADRSRHIIRTYLNYITSGIVPEDDFSNDHYWIPKFGTYQEWLDYCDGLFDFYYGRPEKYLKASRCLMDCEIRKYEHLYHKWYVEIKGTSYFLTITFDANDKNPFENAYYDKGAYYILPKNHISALGYAPYEDKFMAGFYVKVPKTDIERIYKISERKYK